MWLWSDANFIRSASSFRTLWTSSALLSRDKSAGLAFDVWIGLTRSFTLLILLELEWELPLWFGIGVLLWITPFAGCEIPMFIGLGFIVIGWRKSGGSGLGGPWWDIAACVCQNVNVLLNGIWTWHKLVWTLAFYIVPTISIVKLVRLTQLSIFISSRINTPFPVL